MRRFECPGCGARLFYDGERCVRCKTEVGYQLASDTMQRASQFPRCANHEPHRCNWLTDSGSALCRGCRLLTNPFDYPGNPLVATFHAAIRRVLRQLVLAAVWPEASSPPLKYWCVLPEKEGDIVIGHQNGLITLDVSEADPVVLANNRTFLGERYRTPLGHVRHETGHWHWLAAIQLNPDRIESFRLLFGDDRQDYNEALEGHYSGTDTGEWENDYLSYYASSHPWEDYAETFAHVLHMTDTLESAHTEGIIAEDPYLPDFDQLYSQWVRVTIALNELSRSMGQEDPYPFTPPQAAVMKLRYLYGLLHGSD